ncbi:hypothetical protein C8P66_11683 [Humitalea rosea]|uniref:Shikimate kinase n=1 Tax=Humitalea rosea TaxID=990373 RepID=A0A2W7IC66_9PROT|nr:hypothetical protein [Humitalea rosea]PZW43162.1 hypothetical protein C8P66_11683 [Humitalea rosea]
MLATLLPGARFVDGDDHDAPQDAPLALRIAAAMARIEREIAAGGPLVVAYPLDQAGDDRLRRACTAAGLALSVVTLAPPEAVALSDRGARRLTEWERGRVREMYAEGYATRGFSDLIIDTSGQTPGAVARDIIRRL